MKIILRLTVFSLAGAFWSELHVFDQFERVRQREKSQIANDFFSQYDMLTTVLGLIRIFPLESPLIGKR